MAAVPIYIVGTILTKSPKSGGEPDASGLEQCVIHGLASIEGVGVGGGPVIPPPGSGDKPPGIWGGGNVPMPNPPIANVPGAPGYEPKPPDPITPPVKWKPIWTQENGWVAVGVIDPDIPHPTPSGGQPQQPKK